ncbi:hypothetical protein [Salinibaculum rarum]|uniref:hypothetical protein n=1 Tax=Salinibaculum rarum TaxID=3058903 RepID=UPI002660070A|nr:hypothetical protein [Salinibaculum sp. KK48]
MSTVKDHPEDAYQRSEERLGYEAELEVDDKIDVLMRETDHEIAYDILRLSNTPPTHTTMEHVGAGMSDDNVIRTFAYNILLQDVLAAGRARLEARIDDADDIDTDAEEIEWCELPSPTTVRSEFAENVTITIDESTDD